MKAKSEITGSPARKYALTHIRNVGFVGDHYDCACIYNAAADYDPAPRSDDTGGWMMNEDTHYDYIMPDPFITISAGRNGKEYKYNLFCGSRIQKCMLPYIADGIVCSARICPDGGILPAGYWKDYITLQKDSGIPSLIVLGRGNEDSPEEFYKTVETLKQKYGINAVPFVIPLGDFLIADVLARKCFKFDENGQITEQILPAEFAEKVEDVIACLIEEAAEDHDRIMQDFVSGRVPDLELVRQVLREKVLCGSIVPVFYCRPFSRRSFPVIYGTELILEAIRDYLPSPADHCLWQQTLADEESGIRYCCDDAPFAGIVLAHSSKTACFRVLSGSLSRGTSVMNSRTKQCISLPFSESVFSGDIGIMTESDYHGFSNTASQVWSSYLKIPHKDLVRIGIGDFLCDAEHSAEFQLLTDFPEAVMAVSLPFADQKEYDEYYSILERIRSDFPTLRIFTNLPGGLLTAAVDYENLDGLLDLLYFSTKRKVTPEILYREKFRKEITCGCEYGNPSGTSGEYAGCVLEFIPMERGHGITIADCTDKNIVPKTIVGAVRKGIVEAVWDVEIPEHYPLADFHVNILEYSSAENVASMEAFRKAAYAGLKSAIRKAGTDLLEPVVKIKLNISEKFLAELLNLFPDIRGEAAEIVPSDSGFDVAATVPLAEYSSFTDRLRKFQCALPVMEDFRFEVLPGPMAGKIKKTVRGSGI